jgi:hypothetical protein
MEENSYLVSPSNYNFCYVFICLESEDDHGGVNERGILRVRRGKILYFLFFPRQLSLREKGFCFFFSRLCFIRTHTLFLVPKSVYSREMIFLEDFNHMLMKLLNSLTLV